MGGLTKNTLVNCRSQVHLWWESWRATTLRGVRVDRVVNHAQAHMKKATVSSLNPPPIAARPKSEPLPLHSPSSPTKKPTPVSVVRRGLTRSNGGDDRGNETNGQMDAEQVLA